MDRYEFAEGTSRKFWEVSVEGKSVTVRFGRIGTTGQVQVKQFKSPEEAKKARAKGDSFTISAVDVPHAVFSEDDASAPLKALRKAIFRLNGYALGEPMFIQEDPGVGAPFLFQFDERFGGVNLGDSGVMYVFSQTAFWQCH